MDIHLRRIRLAKFSKSRSNCSRILFLFIDLLTSINLRPREIKLICASVNFPFEKFLIYFSSLVLGELNFFSEDFFLLSLSVAVFFCIFLHENDFPLTVFDPPKVLFTHLIDTCEYFSQFLFCVSLSIG